MEVFILTGIHLFSRTLEKYRAGTCGCVDIIARDMSKLKKKKSDCKLIFKMTY